MNKTTLLIGVFSFIGFVVTCLSCNKEVVTGEYLLTDEMKDMNPFQGGETLYFVSDERETFIFKGSERTNQIHKVPTGNDTRYINLYEVNSMWFSSEKDYSFLMEMAGHAPPPPKFTISFGHNLKTRLFHMPFSDDYPVSIDSLKVMGNWHYNIFVNEKDTLDDRAYRIFYTTVSGIIKIDFSDGSSWELERIEWE